jgi:uncharacterized protein with HEPN domain
MTPILYGHGPSFSDSLYSRAAHLSPTRDFEEAGCLTNSLVQNAVIRNIEIIGKTSNNIDKYYQDFAKLHLEYNGRVLRIF